MIEYPPLPPKAALPPLSLAKGTRPEDISAATVAARWISALNLRLAARDFSKLSGLFHEESWWRDFVALTWDSRALHGPSKIKAYLETSSNELQGLVPVTSGGLKPVLMNMGGQWITAGFTFRTKFGTGRGCVYLVNTGEDEWKAWVVYTQLEALHPVAAQEQVNEGKVNGTTTHSTHTDNNSNTPDHTVLIVGAGQSGLALAAHLRAKGIDYLVLDKHAQTGGAWNARYHAVQAHTPKISDHWPFAPYPEDFPMWPKQADIVGWMQSYAAQLELKIRNSMFVTGVTRSTQTGLYSVATTNTLDASKATLTAKHLVLAAGIFAEKPVVPNFPSRSQFKGIMYHTSRHTSASAVPDLGRKRIAVIGSGTSAHDIAADFVGHGAQSVTLIQRGPIFSLSRKSIFDGFMAMYNPEISAASVDEADILGSALPSPVLRSLGVGLTMQMSAWDKEMLDALEAKGVRLKRGEDGDGFPDWLFVKHGCFYIDQGANAMIMDGRIRWKRYEDGVADVDARGVVLKDGSVVEADVVVLATGFQRNLETVKDLMGEEVVNKVGAIGYVDEEGERIGVSWSFHLLVLLAGPGDVAELRGLYVPDMMADDMLTRLDSGGVQPDFQDFGT